jgi:hypothetical protein
MARRRVAILFDDQARPETTGVYCRRALEGLADVQHFRPGELDRVPRQGVDLYVNIDDGLRYRLPPRLRPSAYWAIDAHLDFAWHLDPRSRNRGRRLLKWMVKPSLASIRLPTPVPFFTCILPRSDPGQME